MSQSSWTPLSTSEIREGRLLKRIRKLTQQRDFYKQRHDHYAKVISLQPYLERRYEDYERRKEREKYFKDLEARCKEQELLIKVLRDQLNGV